MQYEQCQGCHSCVRKNKNKLLARESRAVIFRLNKDQAESAAVSVTAVCEIKSNKLEKFTSKKQNLSHKPDWQSGTRLAGHEFTHLLVGNSKFI